ncbi:hypothetical protein HMPREF1322_1707 [Porphyromonas gingivalis W50]|nr:hypothetical protein HMPREF1322_1707 [Porphyromonas gingivalis W50]ERJ83134.1 hypothetical protein HMPREF1988_01256 [Porphyromonas gingivalis F0185]ERJ84468.1 hypothetical protein HMPREF1989_01835 [Porphyromonas gingivalis F0566]
MKNFSVLIIDNIDEYLFGNYEFSYSSLFVIFAADKTLLLDTNDRY